MKYIKIRIVRGNPKKGENQMVYPEVFDAQEVEFAKIGPILYPNEIGKGADEEDCIICFRDDELADTYIAEGKGDVTEITETNVDVYMQTRWEGRHEPEERVVNAERITAVQVKNQIGKKLTTEDEDVLDSDKRVSGINRVNKDHNIFFHRFAIDNQ